MDFSEDINLFQNINRLAENILQNIGANVVNNATRNNDGQGVAVNSNNGTNNNHEDEFEDIYEAEMTENVRYELPTDRQINFIRRYRRGTLNVRLGRRILITAEGENDIHGCEATAWFSDNPDN